MHKPDSDNDALFFANLPRRPKVPSRLQEVSSCLRALDQCCSLTPCHFQWPDENLLRRLDVAVTALLRPRRKNSRFPLGSAYHIADSRWSGLKIGLKLARLIDAGAKELKRLGCTASHLRPALRLVLNGQNSPGSALATEFLSVIDRMAQGEVRPSKVPWEDYAPFLLKEGETIPRLAIGCLTLPKRELYYVTMLERVALETIIHRRHPLGPNKAGPLIGWVEDTEISELRVTRLAVNLLLSFAH